VLQKNFEDIKQAENETLFDFQSRFEGTLRQIPATHRPGQDYVVHLYTHAILAKLGLPLRRRAPKTLDEDYGMAKEIKQNIFSSRIRDLSTIESLYSHENLTDDFQEEGKQTIIQHGMIEDMVEEMEPEQSDEGSMSVPPSDEAIQDLFSPTQQREDEVSCFSSKGSDNTSFHDSESEEEMEALDEVEIPCCEIEDKKAVHEDEEMTHAENIELLEVPAQEETVSYPPILNFDDALPCDEKEEEDEILSLTNPACYDMDSDTIDNIDEFIHVGRCRWDVVGYDLDPIYDTESYLQLLPLQLP
jgi:hypothetical protein